MIRVLIVDDSLTIRAMIEHVLGQERDIEIIGQVADAEEAAAFLGHSHPDVITLDIAMPGMNGLDFLSGLMDHHPYPVVMLSSFSAGQEMQDEALRLGAISCFNKAQVISQSQGFVKAVRAAYQRKKSKPEAFYAKTIRPIEQDQAGD